MSQYNRTYFVSGHFYASSQKCIIKQCRCRLETRNGKGLARAEGKFRQMTWTRETTHYLDGNCHKPRLREPVRGKGGAATLLSTYLYTILLSFTFPKYESRHMRDWPTKLGQLGDPSEAVRTGDIKLR